MRLTALPCVCVQAKCKSGDGEEKPHSCLANAGEPSFPRQARPDSVESSAVHSCIGLKMGSEDSECFDIDRTDSAGKGSFSRRRRKRPSESPEAQSGEHTGKGAVEYDEFDEDVSLDGIDEAELKMRLTKRTLLAAEQHEGEGNDDMEFDRNAGRWMGNESILLDFDEVGASPNRFRASNMRKEATEAASLGAFGESFYPL